MASLISQSVLSKLLQCRAGNGCGLSIFMIAPHGIHLHAQAKDVHVAMPVFFNVIVHELLLRVVLFNECRFCGSLSSRA